MQMMILFGALENGEAVVDCVSKTGRIIDLNEVRDKSCRDDYSEYNFRQLVSYFVSAAVSKSLFAPAEHRHCAH